MPAHISPPASRPVFNRITRLALATSVSLLALTGLSACRSHRAAVTETPLAPTTANRDGIAELHIFCNPVAINLDGLPGPDGIGVRLFASGRTTAKGLPIKQGMLEIAMFDGVPTDFSKTDPSKVWSFPTDRLRAFGSSGRLGVSYQFALPWGDARPRQNSVTVIARYTPPKGGEVVVSDLGSISTSVK